MTRQKWAVLAVICAALTWGMNGIFVKWIDVPVATIAFIRLAVPTTVLFVLFFFTGVRIFRKATPWMVSVSLINGARVFFYFLGFKLTTVSNGFLLLYTWPIFVGLLSPLILKTRLDRWTQLILPLPLIGIFIIIFQYGFDMNNRDFLGGLSMLIASLCAAYSVTVFKKESHRFTPFETIFYQNGLGAVMFLPYFLFQAPHISAYHALLTIGYSIVVGIFAFSLFIWGLKELKAVHASFLSYLEVVSGVTLSIIIFHEPITWPTVVGGSLIILASIALHLNKFPAQTE